MIGTLGRAYRTGDTPDPADVRSPHAHNVSQLESENETSFQLLLRAHAGDEEALERLCARYLPRLHRWARGRLPRSARSAVDTGDIVQDVLIKVVRRIPIFEPRDEGAFQGYLRRALANRLADEARRFPSDEAQRPIDSAWPSPGPSPLEEAIGAEGVARYEAALSRLKADDQRAIVARCEWGMSHEEVAQILGKSSANSARVATHRALVRLAKEMADAKPNART